MSKEDFKDDSNNSAAVMWEWFLAFLKRNRWTIFFGVIGIFIGYGCDTPVIHFIKHLAGKSQIGLDALEGIYFVLSGLVGGGFGAAATHYVRRWMHPPNEVEFTERSATGLISPPSPTSYATYERKGIRVAKSSENDGGDDYDSSLDDVTPRSEAATPAPPMSQDTCQRRAQPYNQTQRM